MSESLLLIGMLENNQLKTSSTSQILEKVVGQPLSEGELIL